ncbi:MAG: hypothetical protein A2527_11480 [Candidatus Lambdaproteobacteria bacterium RIFOXYD2_FULL_50_16]|uniref:Outer membrane protein beta-barrel domain-containing protein n=1 Tax=Candidatus Lambdaproteobacteria bacterium RIFOXYD2_FULL_50_16 TaxID=1817772 RepID=A0A1F6G6M2_9PROT|nr:MAG: hypothetical protein A2527_11480 [Candidatus Lambdaproteobacteria bacterium RIFOXYD2_FULL_50_16]
MLKKIQLWGLGLLALILAPNLQAGDFKAMGGLTFTTQSIPLMGYSAASGYKTDGLDLWIGQPFSQEVDLVYHNLSGKDTTSLSGNSGESQIGLTSWELNYFILTGLLGFEFGPGIGYGVSSTTESNNGTDSSPFLTGTDIHYGVLLLRLGMSFSLFTCDANLSSFGGLIGGSLLCGIEF